MNDAKTPIEDLLEEVPEDAICTVEGNERFPSVHSIPIGLLLKELIPEIRKLKVSEQNAWILVGEKSEEITGKKAIIKYLENQLKNMSELVFKIQ